MVELKLKRVAHGLNPNECSFKVMRKPLRICKRNKHDYIVIGHTKDCDTKDKVILTMLFGNEVIYTDKEIMVPRNFFFI